VVAFDAQTVKMPQHYSDMLAPHISNQVFNIFPDLK